MITPLSQLAGALPLGFDVLGDGEVDESFAVLANLTLDALFQVGKLCAFGLAHIEDIDRAEATSNG